MHVFNLLAIFVGLAALFSFLNYQTLRLPSSAGLLIAGLLASGCAAVLEHSFPQFGIGERITRVLNQVNFSHLLLQGMLGFFLFAGALAIDFGRLWSRKGPILALALGSTALSTILLGLGTYEIFRFIGVPITLIWCLVFGALISPTDPIAVLDMLSSLKAPKDLEITVAGESLFNDGIGVVLFTVLLQIALGHHGGSPWLSGLALFSRDVIGGALLGLGLGYGAFELIRRVDEPNLEILLSVALVFGVEAVAFQLHVSGPIACVVSGILIGNTGRRMGMSEKTQYALDLTWSFADYTMNAILFLFIGIQVFTIPIDRRYWMAFLVIIPLALMIRFISVVIPDVLLAFRQTFHWRTSVILTWGGLRGGISIAMALSLPAFAGRTAILGMTYSLVTFTLIVQALTMRPLLRRLLVSPMPHPVR